MTAELPPGWVLDAQKSEGSYGVRIGDRLGRTWEAEGSVIQPREWTR